MKKENLTKMKKKNYGKCLMTQVLIRGGLANILGAVFMVFYFVYASVHIPSENASVRIVYTAVIIILFGILGIAISMTRLEPKKMKRFYNTYLNTRHTDEFELEIIDYTARMPWEGAKISFRYWFLGALMFSLLFYLDANYSTIFGGGVESRHTLNIFFGVACIGGLFSALFTFLFIERKTADYMPRIFRHNLLQTRQPSHYMNLRCKLLILFLAVGVVPIMTVGMMVLTGDISRLSAAVLSVVIFGIVMAVIAAFSTARSVSRPVSGIIESSRIVHGGNFNAEVFVTAPDELGELQSGFNYMLKGLRERDYIKDIFGRYVTSQVVDRVLNGHIDLGGELKRATILMSDIRGFTRMSENLSPPEVVSFLNEYLTGMVDAVLAEEGRLDKFIGDGLLAVFGAPLEHNDDADRACRVALAMRGALKKLNIGRNLRGQQDLQIGIGIHTGQVVAGNIGSAKKLEYTVIGDAVNVTSRMEQLNKKFKTDILISGETYRCLSGQFDVEALPPIEVAGKTLPLEVYALKGYSKNKK